MAVDDEPDILEVIRLILARLDLKVDPFTSPYDALERLKKEPYDVVLTYSNASAKWDRAGEGDQESQATNPHALYVGI